MNNRKRNPTGPLNGTHAIATSDAMTDDAKRKRDALLMLDVMSAFYNDQKHLIRELKFNYDYNEEEAKGVIAEWEKMK